MDVTRTDMSLAMPAASLMVRLERYLRKAGHLILDGDVRHEPFFDRLERELTDWKRSNGESSRCWRWAHQYAQEHFPSKPRQYRKRPEAVREPHEVAWLHGAEASKSARTVQYVFRGAADYQWYVRERGWYPFLVTLTAPPEAEERMFPRGQVGGVPPVRLFLDRVERDVVAAGGDPSDCMTYHGGYERGELNGMLHLHMLMMISHLPKHWYDPNAGRPSNQCDKTTVSAIADYWAYSDHSEIKPFRSGEQDVFQGWKWRTDENGYPEEVAGHVAGVFYVSNYMNKANLAGEGRRRLCTRKAGMNQLKRVVNHPSLKVEDLEILSQIASGEMLPRPADLMIPGYLIRKLCLQRLSREEYSAMWRLATNLPRRTLADSIETVRAPQRRSVRNVAGDVVSTRSVDAAVSKCVRLCEELVVIDV